MALRTTLSMLTLGLALAASATYDVRYTFVQLTPYSGYPYNPRLDGMAANGDMLAFQPGDIFGPLPSFAFARTAQGDVILAGNQAKAFDGDSRGSIVGSAGGFPFRWVGGVGQALSRPLGYTWGQALVANEAGGAAGSIGYTNANSAPINDASAWNAAGDCSVIGSLPGSAMSEAKGINDHGVVVGRSYYSSVEDRGWVWDGVTLTQLATTPGTTSWNPEDIDNAGLIVGWAQDGSTVWPMTWQNGAPQAWPYEGQFKALNGMGIKVGRANLTGTLKATLWFGNEVIHLPYRIDNVAGTGPGEAKDIDDRGQIMVTNGVLVPRPVFSGTVALDGFEGDLSDVRATVKVRAADGSLFAQCKATLSPSGVFSEHLAVPSGSCTVIVKAGSYLAQSAEVTSTLDGAAGLALTLVGGDIDDNNFVDSDDFDVLVVTFGSTSSSPGWNPNADINGDEEVDSDDFDILVTNFGATGDN